VTAVELEPRFLDAGMKRITESVHKLAAKAVKTGTMTEAEAKDHAELTLLRITPSLDRGALGECVLAHLTTHQPSLNTPASLQRRAPHLPL